MEDGVPGPREITCRELVDFLGAYLARELPPGRREAFDAHLAECSACRAYLSSYAQSVRLGRAATCESDEAPEAVPEELVRLVLAAYGRR